ncbi:MAG: efflux RND transporter permease subunit [Bacteroidota bacterium]|nr:efflux RND transporter permease subunit [Bacteroidota bacterium]
MRPLEYSYEIGGNFESSSAAKATIADELPIAGLLILVLLVNSLAGVVINNAIVLIGRIQIEVDENDLTPRVAELEAAQPRIRPIMLATAAAGGGLPPLWLGGDPPFTSKAVVIQSGLLFVTVLTLGFVLAFYCLPFRVRCQQAAKPLAELFGLVTAMLPEAPRTLLQSSPKLASGCFSTTDHWAKSVLL